MSIQKVPMFQLPTLPEEITSSPDYTGVNTFDIAPGETYSSFVTKMPETAIIDSVFFRVSEAQNSAGQSVLFEVQFDSVPLSALGIPAGAPISPPLGVLVRASPATAVNYEARFPQPFTINKGTVFSITFTLSTGTLTGTGIQFAAFTDDNQSNQFPYVVNSNAFRNNIAPGIGIGLSAVSAVPLQFCWPMNAVPTTHGFRAPDMHGNMISLSGKMRVCGATVWGDVAANAAGSFSKINLYNDAGILLTSGDWEYYLPNNTTIGKFNIIFPTSVNLDPGTYYLAVSGAPHTATTATMYSATFASSFWRGASPMGGTDVMYVSSNTFSSGAPVWTTKNDRQAFIGLLIDGVDDGVQTAGGGETSSVFFA